MGSRPSTCGVLPGVAIRVKSDGTAVPPATFTTSFASVSWAVWLVAVHWIRSATGTVTPPLMPSAKPLSWLPALSIRMQSHDPVESG